MESRSATDLRGFAPDSRRGPSPSSRSFGSRMSLNPYAADARGVSRGPGSSCVGRGAGAGRRCRRLGAVSCQPFGFRLDCGDASFPIGPVPGPVPSAGGHPETGRLARRCRGDPTRPLHLRDRRGSFQAVPGPAPQPRAPGAVGALGKPGVPGARDRPAAPAASRFQGNIISVIVF